MLGDRTALAEVWGWKKGAFTGADKDREGRIVDAHNGTLFLDEIGNADAQTQQNLLRLLQNHAYRPLGSNAEKEIHTRIVAATNLDLREAVRQGRFRQDLYDRLSKFVIQIPGLAERQEDIGPMAIEILRRFNSEWGNEIEHLGGVRKTLTSGAQRELRRYSWPGNVRELENVVTRLAIRTTSSESHVTDSDVRREVSAAAIKPDNGTVELETLQGEINLESILDRVRLHYLKQAWQLASGNKSQVTNLLGFDSRSRLRTLVKGLKASGLVGDEYS
jgi:DNA-binding NtrC family response regulator